MFKRLFCWAYFRGSLFSEGLIIGRNFAFQNGLGLTIKTASTNSPWAYIREGLLSEGFLCLRFGGLIFGRAYFGGGGAYYRNFTVFKLRLMAARNATVGGDLNFRFCSKRCSKNSNNKKTKHTNKQKQKKIYTVH